MADTWTMDWTGTPFTKEWVSTQSTGLRSLFHLGVEHGIWRGRRSMWNHRFLHGLDDICIKMPMSEVGPYADKLYTHEAPFTLYAQGWRNYKKLLPAKAAKARWDNYEPPQEQPEESLFHIPKPVKWISNELDSLPNELWREIPETGGLYSMSSLGRVKRHEAVSTRFKATGGSDYVLRERIVPHWHTGGSYYCHLPLHDITIPREHLRCDLHDLYRQVWGARLPERPEAAA